MLIIILILSLLSLPFPVRNSGFGRKFSSNFIYNGLFTPNFFYNRRGRIISHKAHKNQSEERFQRDQKCQWVYYPSEKGKD